MTNCESPKKLCSERLVFITFIYSLGIFTASFLVSYLIFNDTELKYTYSLSNPIIHGDPASFVYSVSRALLPSTITSFVIFLSAFTPIGSMVSALSLLWRGCCLGCVISTVSNGAIEESGKFIAAGVLLYFMASVMIFIIVSLASLYRKYISHSYAREDYVHAATLSVNFIKSFLVINGATYLFSLIAIILIHTR